VNRSASILMRSSAVVGMGTGTWDGQEASINSHIGRTHWPQGKGGVNCALQRRDG
jgi:hypothetical protein